MRDTPIGFVSHNRHPFSLAAPPARRRCSVALVSCDRSEWVRSALERGSGDEDRRPGLARRGEDHWLRFAESPYPRHSTRWVRFVKWSVDSPGPLERTGG